MAGPTPNSNNTSLATASVSNVFQEPFGGAAALPLADDPNDDGPDLTVSNLSLGAITWMQSDTIAAFWELTNQGDEDAANSTSTLYISSDQTITTSDTALLADTNSGTMSPGQVNLEGEPNSFTFSQTLPAGTYWVGVIADSGNVVSEIDETNNVSNLIQVTVGAPLATVVQFQPGDWDIDVFEQAFLSGGPVSSTTRTSESATSFTVENDFNTLRTTTFDGFGFSFDANGPTSGTITGVTYRDGATVLSTVTGLADDAVQFDQAIKDVGNGDYTLLNNLLATYRYKYDASSIVGGPNEFYGLENDDTLVGSDFADILNGGRGIDLLQGGLGNDTLYGNQGNDVVYGNAGVDILVGGSGDDSLFGGDSADRLYGDAGFDFMDGGENSDVFIIDGNDTVADTGTVGFDKAQINIAAGVTLVLDGWSGVERVNGFSGDDTIDASSQTVGIVLSGDIGADNLIGGSGNDVLLGGSGNDTIEGGAGNDNILGGAGNDMMSGGGGNDTFFVGENLDVIADGGTGFDKVVINNAAGLSLAVGGWTSVERINGHTGNDTIDATGLATDITISGSGGSDDLTGGSGNDVLLGGSGNDTIEGGAGNDNILGGAGNDMMSGGSGNDTFIIGQTLDVVTDGGTGFDKVVINNAAGLTVNMGTWTSIERINGFTGNDAIDATGLATSITMAGSGGNDTLTGGSADDTFYGGSGNDVINGAAGADALIGGNNDDILNGGTGNDFLLGGLGADNFVFSDGFGNDVVKDYTDGTDVLDFAGHSFVNNFSDLTVNQSGLDTIIKLTAGGPDKITLADVMAADLDASDFLF